MFEKIKKCVSQVSAVLALATNAQNAVLLPKATADTSVTTRDVTGNTTFERGMIEGEKACRWE